MFVYFRRKYFSENYIWITSPKTEKQFKFLIFIEFILNYIFNKIHIQIMFILNIYSKKFIYNFIV